jgi:endonuclease-3
MDALTALPGVGRKTANVVLGHALGVPGLPVDRHVLRVANRIGLADSDDAEEVERQLCAHLPKARWTLSSDVMILHGREICRPKPLCPDCAVRDACDFFQSGRAKQVSAAARSAGPGSSRPRRPARPRTPRRP